ncbi:MAG TPA: hypothetical protein VH092_12170 [Urbifossiella sp.]|jgi:hypothetical protein|nr:hypothetical protein [Urbifossiella sp.]
MSRFFLAAALAVGGTAAFSKTAEAQYVYRYNTVNPWTGGVAQQGGYMTPFGAQSGATYVNPYTGYSVQRYAYQNPYGTTVYRTSGYSPSYGAFSSGYYYPGFGASPFAGSFYNYRW